MGCRAIGAVFLCVALPVLGATLPAGAEIEIRLKTAIATDTSKPVDAIEAVVIAPVSEGGRVVIPAGSKLLGSVLSVHQSAMPGAHATLDVEFTELQRPSESAVKLAAKVSEVDNARETVNAKGVIQGGGRTMWHRGAKEEPDPDEETSGVSAVPRQIAGGVKEVFSHTAKSTISYLPGVEMTIRLRQSLDLADLDHPPAVPPIGWASELSALVNAQPFRARAQKPPKASDMTNLMFLGSQEQVEKAFKDAGWMAAAHLNVKTGLETIGAIATQRSYDQAPMSVLLLLGQPPDLVFEKMNNTFAKRHHLRVWRTATFHGMAVWVIAATHDIGVSFSSKDHTFIHKIDSAIDHERTKVINDLIFGGHVRAMSLVDRPEAPRETENATGDKVTTDGKMAVLELR
jgi:hypothetical protein